MENERAIIEKLSPSEAAIFRALVRGQEAEIMNLHKLLYPASKDPVLRDCQQRLGSFVSTANKKLRQHDLRIVPGQARGTYKLIRLLDRVAVA